MTSVPTCDESATVFGMTWAEIFRLRDKTALRFYRKFNQRIPIEELYSAGNEGIALSLRDYPTQDTYPFLQMLRRRLVDAMSDCFYHELRGRLAYTRQPGKKNKVTIKPIFHIKIEAWHGALLPPYEAVLDLQKALTYAGRSLSPRARALLFAACEGATCRELASASHVHRETVKRSLAQSRKTMRAFYAA